MVKRRYQLKIGLVTIAILTMLLSIPSVAMAETVVYSEDFESDNGKYTHKGLSDQWQWRIPTYANGPSAHSGNKVWGTNLASNVPPNSNSYLTSPVISIPALETSQTARVRFFAWIAVDEMLDRGEFQVSSDGINWITKGELFHKMSGGWTDYYFDVSEYAGGNIYLRFRLYTDDWDAFEQSPYNMAGLFIDDVAITIYDVPTTKTVVKLVASEDSSSFASCPWVYTWNGTDFELDNDIYSTARGKTSEYKDFYTLDKPLVPKDGKYLLQLKEIDQETSYTDFLQLITVDHPSDVEISSDENGNILTYSNPSSPFSAKDAKNNSVLNDISTKDGSGVKVYNNDSIVLDFSNLDTSNGAILVLRTIGFQMDDAAGNMTLNKPDIYIQTQDNSGNWVTRNQQYPRSNWTINAYNLTEYLTSNKLVRLYVTSCHEGKYHIIDYAVLDTSLQQPIIINKLFPISAMHSINGDVLNAVNTSDNKYATMNPVENISIAFNSISIPTDHIRDFVLVSEGYYVPSGTYFIYTWDGSKWVQRDGWSIEGSGQKEHNFDLSQWLPDPTGEYKIRIWQDYWYEPATIDFIGITQDGNAGTMSKAYDLRKSLDVTTQLKTADGSTDYWGPSDSGYPYNRNRNRWVEVEWTGLSTNTPPTTNPVSMTNTESLTPTISWTYNDAEGNPQQQYQLEIWTGSEGTGTNLWTTSQSSMYTSVTYAGNSLVGGNEYYARVRAFDGSSWGGWSEAKFIPFKELTSKIRQEIKKEIPDQPYLLNPKDFDSAVGAIWMNGFDKMKADNYNRYYFEGLRYRDLRIGSLSTALASAKRGEATRANEYLTYASNYLENADTSFENAYGVYDSSLSWGIFVAKSIRTTSQIAFKSVAASMVLASTTNPAAAEYAGQVLDLVFIAADDIVDGNTNNIATDLVTEAIFIGVTDYIKFPELGDKTINDYLKNQPVNDFGAEAYPAIRKAVANNDATVAIVVEDAVKRFVSDMPDEWAKYIANKITENIDKFLGKGSYQKVSIKSPGELRVYDSSGNMTGLVSGKTVEDIPNSIYDAESKSVILLGADDTYIYEVVGTDTGEYGLDLLLVRGTDYIPVSLQNTIVPNEVHQYTVDWNSISTERMIKLNIDSNNDGIFDTSVNLPLPTTSFAYAYLTNQHINLDGSFSEGDIVSYKWDFGDGTNGNGKMVDHIYSAEGDYAVTLTVENDNGGIDSKTRNIRIDFTSPITTADISGTLGDDKWYTSEVQVNLTSTDGMKGTGINKTEYSFDNSNWSIYNAPFNISNKGIITLYYHSIDNAGNIELTKSETIQISEEKAPITVDVGSDQIVEEEITVNFEGSFTASGSHTYSYHWDFGDGTAEDSSLITSHIYADDGAYTVNLTVTDEEGDFGNDTLLVTVNNAMPVVDSGSDLEVTAGDPVSFTGTFSDSGWLDTHTAEWNFGEGTVEAGSISEENESPDSTGTVSGSFSYFDAGEYTVTLNVTDDDGGIGQDQAIVTVRPIEAEVNFDPDTLNLGSGGNWVTAYIELSKGYSASNIDINSILLNGIVPAVSDSKYGFVTNENEYLTDLDKDGISERMFKFNRGEVEGILEAGDQVTVTFTGKVEYNNGISSGMASFEGSDVIKVTEKDSKNDKTK